MQCPSGEKKMVLGEVIDVRLVKGNNRGKEWERNSVSVLDDKGFRVNAWWPNKLALPNVGERYYFEATLEPNPEYPDEGKGKYLANVVRDTGVKGGKTGRFADGTEVPKKSHSAPADNPIQPLVEALDRLEATVSKLDQTMETIIKV